MYDVYGGQGKNNVLLNKVDFVKKRISKIKEKMVKSKT